MKNSLTRLLANLIIVIIASFTLPQSNVAQDNYFQQEVNYQIKVTLDDTEHILNGDIEMTYVNNAPEALNEIYIHLWANAHQNRGTALAKQKLRMGSTRLYFAGPEDLGGYSDLNFTVDGQQVAAVYDEDNPDILKLILNSL